MYQSNIDELTQHVKSRFQNMFKSKELEEAGRKAHEIMYKNVNNRMQMSGYDYEQTGNFREIMADEKRGFDPRTNASSMKIGVGLIGEGQGLEDPRFGLREEQKVVFSNGRYNNWKTQGIPMTLKAEKQMPKWIVLEFGTRSKADPLPNQFKIAYTRRSERDLMYGPSLSNPSGHKKKVFAMLSSQQVDKLRGSHKGHGAYSTTHPGTRPGRFFKKGLEDSKVPVFDEFGRGIQKYLDGR
jgi:hypothetical protein